MRVTFEEVKICGDKTVKCQCGKRVVRKKTFYQTLNPFNQFEDGTVKTRGDIFKELVIEADKWEKEPELCKDCR